jgi:flagellum-specific peptidoglycan hydrolase FlgJ
MVKKYGRRCESVADYINLLNKGTHFEEYRELRIKQMLTDAVNLNDIIHSLAPYASDPFYGYKVRDTVSYLFDKYPHIFN